MNRSMEAHKLLKEAGLQVGALLVYFPQTYRILSFQLTYLQLVGET